MKLNLNFKSNSSDFEVTIYESNTQGYTFWAFSHMIIKRVRGMPSLQSGYRIFYEDENMATQSIRSNGWSHSKGNVEAPLTFTAYGWEENVLDAIHLKHTGLVARSTQKMHLQFASNFMGRSSCNNVDTRSENISHLFMKSNKVKMSFTVWALNFDSRDSLLVSLDGNVAHSVYFDKCDVITYWESLFRFPFRSQTI